MIHLSRLIRVCDGRCRALGEFHGPALPGSVTKGTILSALTRRRWRAVAAVAVPLLLFVSLLSWAVSSPLGSSPDDDYHLASIWCGNGEAKNVCESGQRESTRFVPASVAGAPHCYAFNPGQSAACSPRSNDLIATDRGNWNGHAYPGVFYSIMNVFVGDDVDRSVLAMRASNAALYIGITVLLFFVLPRHARPALLWGALISVVPLGMFLIPSVNPSSWAILSATGLWVATWGYFMERRGIRKWLLAGMMILLLIIGAGARSDAAVYGILALFVGGALGFRRDRRFAVDTWLPLVLVGIAAVAFLNAGQSAVVAASTVVQHDAMDVASLTVRNFMDLPLLWVGVFGAWGMGGLGWLDTAVPPLVWVSTLMAFGGLVFWGLRRGSAGKWLSVAAIACALVAIPMYILVHDGVTVGVGVQPRYIYPLMIMLAGVVLVGLTGFRLGLGRVQLVCVGVILSVANSLSLHVNMRRYLTGVDVDSINLDVGVEWWWNTSVSPMAVWIGGTIAFALAVSVLFTMACGGAGPQGRVTRVREDWESDRAKIDPSS